MDEYALINRNDPNDPVRYHFLGCSIRNFDLNIGWAGESTSLTVGLVEDDLLFERFNGFIGGLVRFQYDEFFFDGILNEVNEVKGESGRVWEVSISDPRELLDGIHLILDQYAGYTYNVSNIYNIYGYLESTGFGNAGVNSSGMLLNRIVSSFRILNSQTPVYLGPTPIFIDISELPTIDPYFRIPESNMSLLSLVTYVCELFNFDFTFVMTGNILKLRTVTRNIRQLNGSIYRFIQSLNQISSSESGFKLQYSPSSKFIVGGQVEQVYFQHFDSFNNNFTEDDLIARYFGLNVFGNVITPVQDPKDYYNQSMLLPAQTIGYVFYPTDIRELRAALGGRDAWDDFIHYYSSQDGIHKGKLSKISLVEDTKSVNEALQDKNILTASPKGFISLQKNDYDDFKDAYAQRIYDFVYNYATYYLDKRFMVRIPYVEAKYSEEFNKIISSMEPTESGYIDESLFPDMIQDGLLPEYTNFILDQNNKILAFARFGPFLKRDIAGFYSFNRLDISALKDDDYYIQDIPHQLYGFVSYLFVKCTLEENLVFINRPIAYSPRVVVELSGPVYYTNSYETLNILEWTYIYQELLKLYTQQEMDIILASDWQDKTKTPAVDFEDFRADVNRLKEEFKKWRTKIGFEIFDLESERPGMIPNMVAIPLRNNKETYGPWYVKRNNGKTIYEKNDSMVPWNYGGFDNMNQVGLSLASDVLSETMIEESGVIELPGTPIFKIVDEIVPNGPVITGVSTSIGDNGVRTTYRMEKWKSNYGKLNQIRIEQQQKIITQQRESSRRFRELFNKPKPIDKTNALLSFSKTDKPRKYSSKTSHLSILSEVYQTNQSGNPEYSINTGIVPAYHISNITDRENFSGVNGMDSLAIATLDNLFVPFDFTENEYLPVFDASTNYVGDEINKNSLNPFKSGTNIDILEKGVALRGPVMIAGWGYDTSDEAISSASGYLKTPSEWKVGPLDVRWDESTGVWLASGGGGTKFFKLVEDALGNREVYARECNDDGDIIDEDSTPVKIINWQGIINNALAGYSAKFEKHEGRWKFGQGHCPLTCEPNGSITFNNEATGQVGEPFTHEIIGSGLSGAISVADLPDGLSYSSGSITGTPTASGDSYVTVSAESQSETGSCTITKMLKISIEEAEEEE